MTNLIPCPFCGKSNAKVRHEKHWRPKLSSNVICKTCFANTGWFNTDEEAIQAWNRRAKAGEQE